ncbi:MAG TPA: phosphotransferase [Novosphingobium sp.]|nr:phosphotransferase [Novosphingobium sp.]
MSEARVHPLPMTLEEITPAWLTAALRTRAAGVTVRGAEIVDVNNGTCTKVRMRLDMDEAGRDAGIPELVMLKGGFETHSRNLWHILEAEVVGYRDVFPVLKLPAPACYFADYAPDQGQGIVVMEDLVARNVTFCDARVPQTFEQVARRLEDFARFHAQTWNTPEFKQGRWDSMRMNPATLPNYLAQYFVPSEWERFTGLPRGAAASVRFHDRDLMRAMLDKVVAYSEERPQVLIHGDAHLGNLYISADGSPGFFDSLPSRGPAMRDIAYHVCGALDTADRRRWEGALIHHYLQELKRNGVADVPPFDDMMREYAVFLLVGYLIFLINESFYQLESINTAYVARFSAAMIDHDTVGLLQAMG